MARSLAVVPTPSVASFDAASPSEAPKAELGEMGSW